MVNISSHLAFGRLFALPAWYGFDGRSSLGVVALAAVAALLPDVDLVWDDAARIDDGFLAVMGGTYLWLAYLPMPADRRHRRRPQ